MLMRLAYATFCHTFMDRKRYTFWIDVDQAAALKRIKTRDGVPESEQLRRAIAAWIDARWRTAIRRGDGPRKRAPESAR